MAGAVLAQQVEREAAPDREVLGGVADADAAGVLVEGHVEDPVAADNAREGGRIHRGAEQVVAPLNLAFRPDAPLRLYEAEGEHRRVGDDPGAAQLQPPVALAGRPGVAVVLMREWGEGGGPRLGEDGPHAVVQGGVDVLQHQDIVPPLRHDLGGDGGLAAQRVDGHRRAVEGEQAQQRGNGGALVRLVVHRHLPQHQPAAAGPRAHQVERGLAVGAVVRAAQRLAVQRHHLPGRVGHHRPHPVQKAAPEFAQIEAGEGRA